MLNPLGKHGMEQLGQQLLVEELEALVEMLLLELLVLQH